MPRADPLHSNLDKPGTSGILGCMNRPLSLLGSLIVAAAGLAAPLSAGGQVVIYELKFKQEASFNVDFFDGGYFIAPALGGSGSFVLTAKDNGRKVLTSSGGSGSFFTGSDGDGKRMTVISASASNSTTLNASYVAMGEADNTVTVRTENATIKLKVAKELKGHAVAAGDESSSTTTAEDGSSSFASIASMTANLDEGATNKANDQEMTVDEAAAQIVTELKQKGYVEETTDDGSTDDGSTDDGTTDDSTDTSTTTTTTSSSTSTGTQRRTLLS